MQLVKQYASPDSGKVFMDGALDLPVIRGNWRVDTPEGVLYNIFMLYPENYAFSEEVEVYGYGASCQYPTDWRGETSVNGGMTGSGSFWAFTVDPRGALTASGEDTWG